MNNPKLRNFIENVYGKFDIHKDDQITQESFKKVVLEEPHLLEIFDYFNKGISESLNPIGEIDPRDQKIIEDVENLENNLLTLKTYLEGKNEVMYTSKISELPTNHLRTSIENINSPVIKNLENITRSIFFKPLKKDLGNFWISYRITNNNNRFHSLW